MPEPLRVLAVDPALRNTGWAVLQSDGKDMVSAGYGVIVNPAKLLHSGCLLAIREQLSEVIKRLRPVECAIESTIYVQSFKTAITLGSVRGAVLIAAAEHGLAGLRLRAARGEAGRGRPRRGAQGPGRVHGALDAAAAGNPAAGCGGRHRRRHRPSPGERRRARRQTRAGTDVIQDRGFFPSKCVGNRPSNFASCSRVMDSR